MIEKFIHRLLLRRHFWRHVTLSEVAELYAARLLRMTAGSLISVMAAVYMFMNGYSVLYISVAYACYFLFKAVASYPCARVIARFGPKHGMLFANILMIPSLLFFLMLPEWDFWALFGHLIFYALSIALYDMSHMVNFSKVQNVQHAGRELGFMNIMDKIAKGLSPLLGGLAAWIFGPDVTIWVASALFLLSAIPLFLTAEPVRIHQKIRFAGYPWKQTWRSLVAEAAVGVDNVGSGVLWQLFLVAIVLAGAGDEAYAKIGALASVTLIVGLIVPRIYGRIVDRRRGLELLQYGVATNAILHFLRPAVGTPVAAGMLNVMHETSVTAYAMSFMRGMFDLADRSGHRIAYLYLIEVAINLGSAVMFAVAAGLLYLLGDGTGLSLSFVVVGCVSLVIASAHFPLYRRR